MIDLKGSEITVDGPLWRPDADKRLRENLYDAVEEISEAGAGWARAGVTPRTSSGQTRGGIEAYVQRRAKIGGGDVGTLFGKVRMRPEMTRLPDSTGGRRPYIIAAILEGGNYRKARRQRPLFYFRKAATKMRAFVRSIKTDLARGLD